jgi:membrane fusion protein (multidrug efflux system)
VQFQVNGVPLLAGQGAIDLIYPSLDEATRSFRCRVIIANSDLRFRPGMLMKVSTVLKEVKGVLVVPSGAVFQQKGSSAVRVAKENGYEERYVTTGMEGLNTIEIVDGLQEGEKVLMLNPASSSMEAPSQ